MTLGGAAHVCEGTFRVWGLRWMMDVIPISAGAPKMHICSGICRVKG